MSRDLKRELEEWNGWPPAWKPEREGDILIATVLRYDVGTTAYGQVRTVLLQRDDGTRVSLWLSSRVLLSLFEQHRPQPGEKLGLRYLGRHATKNYHLWRLIVDREEAPVSFEPLGGEEPDDDTPEPPPARVASPAPPRSAAPPPARRPSQQQCSGTDVRIPAPEPDPSGGDPFDDGVVHPAAGARPNASTASYSAATIDRPAAATGRRR